MNPLLKSREVEYYLADSGARLLLAAKSSPGEPARARRPRASRSSPPTRTSWTRW